MAEWNCEKYFQCVSNHFNAKKANLSALSGVPNDTMAIKFRHLETSTVDHTITKHFPPSVQWLEIIESGTLQRIVLESNCTLKRLVVMKTLLTSLEFHPNDALRVLKIISSKLQQIPSTIKYLRNLTVIQLQQSYILHANLDLLVWFRELDTLELGHNRIRTITSTLSSGERRKLHLLNLNNNQLRIINLEVLAPLAWFEHVDLSHNKIELLVGRFASEVLSSLLLTHNRLKTLDFCQWKPLPSLQSISLESNELARLPRCMHRAPKLSYICISHNKLTSVNMDTFGDMDNLTRLDLAGNHISLITFREEKHPKGLVHLNLKQNKLE
uniref:Leucine rich immune protein (Coil-less) n=1 Tax=Anopheles maculatus TaxID=74869 RepID=A0A182T5R8_9DIPT